MGAHSNRLRLLYHYLTGISAQLRKSLLVPVSLNKLRIRSNPRMLGLSSLRSVKKRSRIANHTTHKTLLKTWSQPTKRRTLLSLALLKSITVDWLLMKRLFKVIIPRLLISYRLQEISLKNSFLNWRITMVHTLLLWYRTYSKSME
jgi:hypothetical protein